MVFDYKKYEFKRDKVLKDPRTSLARFQEKIRKTHTSATVFGTSALGCAFLQPYFGYIADVLLLYNGVYFFWLTFMSPKPSLPFKMPKTAAKLDPNNKAPGSGKPRMADGILYLGNEEKSGDEIWFTNSDARTHILYLGTTGSGKTEGLKSMVTNALGWGSGFIYVDGKADTDLWGSLSALARRYGRDDDLLVLNYMTGNSENGPISNTVNPFSSGSASYLTNLLVSLMPEGGGDNAMWKDRAVALIAALMPVLAWRRQYQERVLNIATIRDAIRLERIIEMSRMTEIPEKLRKGLRSYLYELPGYVDIAFNDDGTEKPAASGPPADYSTIRQQHGYLSMQFTRQMQSLSDDYGYIFETPSADIDMMDVVLNRRLVVVLIPALEKSADETANLGKIVGSMLKGMMGATLGSTVEGDTEMALENKPTRSSTPFMAIFDEVGYYTTQGMAVMAAQARSLGFCLIYAGQDLPALEKRIKEEARSITANCNLKIFGKLEDPTQTKEFFEKTVGETTVIESSTRKQTKMMFGAKKWADTENYNVTSKANASYSQLKSFSEGQSVVAFGDRVVQARMMLSDVGKIRSLRVNKFISMPHPDPDGKRGGKEVDAILERMRDKKWTAQKAAARIDAGQTIPALAKWFESARAAKLGFSEAGAYTVTQLAIADGVVVAGGEQAALTASATPDPVMPQSTAKPLAAPVPTAPLPTQQMQKVTAPPVSVPVPVQAQAQPQPNPVTLSSPSVAPPSVSTTEARVASNDSMSWAQLVGDDDKADIPAAPPAENVVAESVVTPAVAAKLANHPSTKESFNWADLVDDKDENPPPVTSTAPAQAGAFPLGGFGVGSFGTGFGGIGFAPATYAPVAASQPTPEQETEKSKLAEEKIEKALNENAPLNWNDIVE